MKVFKKRSRRETKGRPAGTCVKTRVRDESYRITQGSGSGEMVKSPREGSHTR